MTKAQKNLHQALRDMGCCVGLFVFDEPGTPCDIHHIVEGGKRLGEEYVIPLHPIIHRQGNDRFPSIHSVNGNHGGKKLFKAAYGFDEYQLLELCKERFPKEYADAAG